MVNVEENPFINFSKKIKTVNIGGIDIKLKPKLKDAELFCLTKKDITEQDMARISGIFVSMIKRAYEMEKILASEEDIQDFVAEHYGELFNEVAVLFGFTTKKEMEELKKKEILSMVQTQPSSK